MTFRDLAASQHRIPGSFRDPSGFLFKEDGVLHRKVNHTYREHYERFVSSGLAADLLQKEWLIPYEEVAASNVPCGAFKILRPELIRFVSYPYEWSFGQVRDAAILTLRIQELALKHGMSLKDASAYNVQFHHGKPVLIDTLSFEIREAGKPWVAYRQFCQHFLAPLALIAYRDIRLSQLLRVYLDGVPLDLASALLPRSTWARPSLLAHIHLHARAQRRFSGKSVDMARVRSMTEMATTGLLESLRGAIERLEWKPEGTEWAEYYSATNYSDDAMVQKTGIVEQWIDAIHPSMVWDLGANVGRFSRLATSRQIETVAFDVDPAAVERNYRAASVSGDRYLLPLVMDFTNPSGGMGWAGEERQSLAQRGPADVVLALALLHHLAIGNNVPFRGIADWLSQLARQLVIEFVPKTDSQVQRMLSSRQDIFENYNEPAFVEAFAPKFSIVQRRPIAGSDRVLYWMTRNS